MGRRPDPADAPDGDALRRAKAVASPARQALLRVLESSPSPVTAQQLARPLGVHHTAVRQHMAVLIEAGLVRTVHLAPEGRGRPRVAYVSAGDPDPYRRLAAMLADAASDGLTPQEAGRRHGMQVPTAEGDAIDALVGETERLGFRPLVVEERDTVEIVLQSCPFAAVAASSPAVVCGLHRGIAEGVAARTGAIEVIDLRPADPHTAGCRLLARRLT